MVEVKLEDAPQGVRTFYDKDVAAMERAVKYSKEIYSVDIGYQDVAVKTEQTYRKP